MRAVAALSHCVWLGRRDYEGWRAWTLCTDIMNWEMAGAWAGDWDSVTASGALLLVQREKKRGEEGGREAGRGEGVN